MSQNFVGAEAMLEEHCSKIGIKWRNTPPQVTASRRSLGICDKSRQEAPTCCNAWPSLSTAEHLTTLFTQIEAILNSHPLYRKLGNVERTAIDFVTPGHFLVSSHLLNPALTELIDISLTD